MTEPIMEEKEKHFISAIYSNEMPYNIFSLSVERLESFIHKIYSTSFSTLQ